MTNKKTYTEEEKMVKRICPECSKKAVCSHCNRKLEEEDWILCYREGEDHYCSDDCILENIKLKNDITYVCLEE